MKEKCNIDIVVVTMVAVAVILSSEALAVGDITGNETFIHGNSRAADRRPPFWTKTANDVKVSTLLRMHKPYENLSKLQKRLTPEQETENQPEHQMKRTKPRSHQSFEETNMEEGLFETTTIMNEMDDLESKIMKDESFIGLKDFAGQLINDTTKFFLRRENAQSRSYPVDDQPQHQPWDDKDQTFHASNFATAEYEPTSFHHHYIPPPPVHYFPPPKKEDALLTKVALIALLKLILAKLKAIGFIKLMFLFMMKIPILFFKFLFILKGFKLLKLVSIPFMMASFAAPFLPLIPFLAPLLFAPVLIAPLFLPLLLPLLFFLPIVPVTTPATASATTSRKRRNAFNVINNPLNWTSTEDAVKDHGRNDTRARPIRVRSRPISYDSSRKSFQDNHGYSRFIQDEDLDGSSNFIELTQKVMESQHCLERVACELASQNDSKIYQSAVIWALGEVHTLASPRVKRKIERYSNAYKTGANWQSSDVCQAKFYCQRPRVLLIQGKSRKGIFLQHSKKARPKT